MDELRCLGDGGESWLLARQSLAHPADANLRPSDQKTQRLTKPRSPTTTGKIERLHGARTPNTPLPPPPLPAGSLRAQRKVHSGGRIMVANQSIKFGSRHAGKLVTVIIEDTHLRVLHGEEEIAARPRKNPGPVTRLYVKGKGTQPERQSSPDDKTSSTS